MEQLFQAMWSSNEFDEMVIDLIPMNVVCADPNMLTNSIIKSYEATELRRETYNTGDCIKIEIASPRFPITKKRVLIIFPVDFITNESEVI